ncbi:MULTISPECIES: plasmid mobilization relaxosome protein MobC [Paracoccaceae]|uniref:plasmid mobilization relaxosome protein MobC n=1 Tax=Paracoccaceae TaxID=31989 RepID=UPI0015725486|nr:MULTISPECIES: plasmid mobilization relaxosome protein MobC [Paracoccaceae]MBJ2153461.1 plasmid mobilization relaxosome protein MobC [Paracoccus sp. IB05]NTT88443.1 plasmid mobilization relaxosome protein MobC [Tabrizicola sp. SY72]
MAKARRLTEEERLRIAKERSEGVSARELASRYGVSVVSVYNAVNHASGRRISNGSRTRVLNLRVSEAELRAFDASLSRRGITHRTDALRRFVMAADDLLAPDEYMTEELRGLGAALNRVGNNINQIARRLNEGRVRGEVAKLSVPEQAEIRALAGLVFDMSDQIQELARNRRRALELEVSQALAPLVAEVRDGPR